MSDFLLELRSEEIPARMQEKARADLERLFAAELAKSGLAAAAIKTYATPRRLALIAHGLPAQTEAVSEEVKGPKATAPEQALEGFLRKTGLTRADLTERDGILFAVTQKPGRATAEVLAEAIPAIIRAFPWPKSMRWGEASHSTESLRWVRPLQGIVALLGDTVIPCDIAGITSGRETAGHRFLHKDPVTIASPETYAAELHAAHVIVDGTERRRIIAEGAAKAATDAGLELIEDEGLLFENAGLTEWPVPLLGRFDEAFLQVPPEVIQLTARVNQKYFVCRDGAGELANAFVCTANIAATDGGKAIVEGNQKVLAARLSDARFFWDQDLKVPLDDQAKKLDKIVFHEKLGTVADKVDRVAKLARWLVEEGVVGGAGLSSATPPQTHPRHPREGGGPASSPATSDAPAQGSGTPAFAGVTEERAALADMAERAARLAKADLVTGMVGEFPELQGQMGGHYARAQGEDPRVADAIRDHYKPVGQGDEVPTAPVTVAVSLADKLDTLYSFFAMREFPTGSRDPFALRRSGLGLISLLESGQLRIGLKSAMTEVLLDDLYSRTYALFASSGAEAIASTLVVDPNARIEEHDGKPYLFVGDDNLGRANEADVKAIFAREQFLDGFWDAPARVIEFLIDRLKVQQREAGVRHDLIDAVFALGGEDDLVRLLARVHALQAFMATPDGANLLAGYRRAANILKKEGWSSSSPLPPAGGVGGGHVATATAAPVSDMPSPDPASGRSGSQPDLNGAGRHSPDALAGRGAEKPLSYTPEPAETALTTALDSAAPRAQAAIEAEDFEGAMAALATLRAPIDAFFDSVTVNDPAPEKREARLNLLARMRDAVHSVADFSKIEG